MLDRLESRRLLASAVSAVPLQPDADLNGKVDLTDFGIVAGNFNKHHRSWTSGDFDFSGSVDLSDFTLLAAHYGEAVVYAPKLIITHGGTFTGAFDGIQVQTTEFVRLEGILTRDTVEIGSRANVYATRLSGTSPDGNFIEADGAANLSIVNCSSIGSRGVDIHASNGVRILGNTFTNFDGLYEHGHLVLDDCDHAVISGNVFENAPGKSKTEDVVLIYKSFEIDVTHNLIVGSYPPDPQSSDFSGGGILVDYGSYLVRIDRNVVVNTTNYGIAIGYGQNSSITNNLVVMDELLPATNVGYGIWNGVYHDPTFGFNGGSDNRVSMINRNNWFVPDAAYWLRNTAVSMTALQARAEWESLHPGKVGA